MNPKILYHDVFNGYSELFFQNQQFYIKHINHTDIAKLETEYEIAYKLAIENGFPLKKDRELEIIQDQSWPASKEKKLKSNYELLGIYDTNIKKSYKISAMTQGKQFMADLQKEIDELELQKNILIGKTAESFANKRKNEKYIQIVLFKDSKLTLPYYTEEQFIELDDNYLTELANKVAEIMDQFNSRNFLKIALDSFYFNYFILSKGDIRALYGKAILQLTYNQLELFNESLKIENILTKYGKQIPKDYFSDPDKIINYYIANENVEAEKAKSKNGDFAPAGMTKEDAIALGLKNNIVDFGPDLEKHGGTMDFEQSLKAGVFNIK